jgi:hypothetical protein
VAKPAAVAASVTASNQELFADMCTHCASAPQLLCSSSSSSSQCCRPSAWQLANLPEASKAAQAMQHVGARLLACIAFLSSFHHDTGMCAHNAFLCSTQYYAVNLHAQLKTPCTPFPTRP